MRHVLGTAGVAAAGVLLLVSACTNWRFGYSLGKSEFESDLYGAASAAAWAFERLRPQNSRSLWDLSLPFDRAAEHSARGHRCCGRRRDHTIEFSRAVTKPRLGVDLTEIPGAHSPFLARPGELARLLDELTVASN